VGAKYAVVCSSGTAALHLSILALNIKPVGCVLTTPKTFVVDANAARFVVADVTFSDIDRSTVNMDMKRLEESLKSRSDIRVVIPVHFAGRPVEMERLADIAEKYNVTVVEDGCHVLGSYYQTKDGRKTRVESCKHSTMTVFSFHPIKSITTGTGGAITTNYQDLYEHLLQLRNHSITHDPSKIINKNNAFTEIDGEHKFNPWYYEMQDLSPNYRITDFQCALGRSQLRELDGFIERRNTLDKIYEQAIYKRLSDLVIPLKNTNTILHAQHLFVVREYHFINLKEVELT
jgi:dTDP-4-amino-4,6-dideoxygalactose transaminase